MVAIFTGLGAGAERGSGNVLGGAGLLGSGTLGRSAEQVLLNAATGNLMIQQQDEMLVGLGPDAAISRTYNSQGNLSDDNADNWRQSTDRRVYGLTGSQNALNSTVKRVSADGSEITYTCDANGVYWATDGAGAYDKLTWNSGTSTWTWTDGDTQATEAYGYSSGGQYLITKQTDASGNVETFSYVSGTSHLDKVTTADGSYVQYSWSGNNITQLTTGYTDLVTSTAKTLTRTRYTYDSYNRLSTVTVDLSPDDNSIADGKTYTTTYTYKANSGADMHLVSSIAETDGSLLTITYDASQRVTSLVQTAAAGVTRTTSIAYLSSTQTAITDPTGQVTTLDYDANGNLTKITAPPASAGQAYQVTKFGYDAATGNVTSVTDPLGGTTTYSGFVNGEATTITDPLGNVTARTFGTKNELLTETVTGDDQSGTAKTHTTRYVYDANDRLVFSLSADGNVVEHRYDTNGREWLTLTYVGQTYDLSALTSSQAPTQAQMNSWVSALSDPTAVDQMLTYYDARGNITTVVGYAASTNPGTAVAAKGYSYTSYVYNQAGQLLSRKDYSRNAETFVYDGLGRMVSSVDIQGGTTSVLFDDANARTIVTAANGLSQTSTYNKAGDLVSVTQSAAPTGASNLAPTLTNTSQWAPARVSSSAATIDGASATKFQVTSTNGGLTTGPYTVAAGDTITWEITLMGVGSTLSDTLGIYGSSAGWGDGTNVTATILSGPGTISVQSGGPSQVSGLSTSTGTRVRITRTFTAADTVSGYFNVVAPNTGTTSDAVVLANANVVKTTAADPQVTVATTQYRYDQLGRVRWVTDATGHNSYVLYDNDGRKVGDVDQNGALTEYKYDADNRVIATVRYATALISTQITALQNTTAAFDLATNRPAGIPGDLWTFNVYDKDGNKVEVIDGAGDATTYSYDASGKLIGTTTYANKLSPAQITALQTSASAANLKPDLSSSTQWQRSGLNLTGSGPYQYTATGTGGNLFAGNFTVAAGDTLTFEVTVRGAGSTLSDALGFNASGGSGWGDGTNVTATILSGPGAITTQNGAGPGSITGLSTSADTRIRITRTFTAAGTASLLFYVKGLGANIAAAGDAVILSNASITQSASTAVTLPVADSAHDAVSRIFYDKTGRVVGTLDGEGYLSTVTYDAGGFKVAETAYANKPANGATAPFATLAAATSAADRTTHYVYDNNGQLRFVVDAQNHVTEYFYSNSADVIDGKATKTTQYDGVITPPSVWSVTNIQTAISNANIGSLSTNRVSNAIYDAREDLIYAIDPAGGFTAYTYDTMGHVTKAVRYATAWDGSVAATFASSHAADSGNRTTRSFYDARGDITYTVDGEGYVTRYDYDGEDRLVGTAQWDVVVAGIGDTTLTTDIPGLIATAMAGVSPTPAVITTATSYDMDGRVATTTDGVGAVTSYAYNVNGTLYTVTRGYGTADAAQTRYLYDAAGRVQYRYDANGAPEQAITQYAYNAFGQVVTTTDPLLNTVTNVYYLNGRLKSSTDQEGLATSYTYDAFGDVVSTTDPLLKASYAYYDALGRVVSTRDADNRVVETSYDTFGDVISVTRRANATTQTDVTTAPVYAATGASIADAARDSVTSYAYDNAGRLKTTTNAEGGVTSVTYNGFGELSVETDPFGASTNIQTTDTYDKRGLLKTQVVDSASGGKAITTGYGYDGFGRRTSVTNALTKVSHATYDNDGRLVSTTDPLGNVTTNTYDKRGNLVAVTDAAGKVTRYIYDQQDRKVAMIDAVGAVTTYGYDGDSNLVSTRTYAAALSPSVFAALPIQATVANYSTLSTSTADNVTYYVYDKDGRLRFTVDALGHVAQRTYDADGNVIRTTAYDGMVTPGSYSITSLTALVASMPTRVTRAVYDPAGQLVYSIDAMNQVTGFTYDAFGNVIKKVEFAAHYTDADDPSQSKMLNIWVPGNGQGNGPLSSDRTTFAWYDRNGHERYALDAMGYVTRFDYNKAGEVTQQTAYADVNATFSSPTGNLDGLTLASLDSTYASPPSTARVTQYSYDSAGRLETTTTLEDDPAHGTTNSISVTTRVVRDAMGRITSSTAAYGSSPDVSSTTTYQYDDAGHLVQQTDGSGTSEASTTWFFYDALGRKAASVDGDNYLTVWTYDADGRATGQTQYANKITGSFSAATTVAALQTLAGTSGNDEATSASYDALGRVYTSTDARGTVTTNSYDAIDELASTTLAMAGTGGDITTAYTYNNFGEVVKTVDPNGNARFSYYDALGRVTRQVDAERYVTDTTYTRGGQIQSVTRWYNQLGTGVTVGVSGPPSSPTADPVHDATTSFAYDNDDRLTKVIDAAGDVGSSQPYYEQYTLDAFGDRVTVRNRLGGTSDYVFDKRGLLVSETMHVVPAGGGTPTNIVNSYTYDLRGNRTQMVEASGAVEARTTNYSYDHLDRLTKTTHDAVSTMTLTDAGLVAASGQIPTDVVKYDDRGNVIEQDQAITVSGTTTAYARTLNWYDAFGNLVTSVVQTDLVGGVQKGTLSAFGYDKNGNRTSATTYGDLVTLPTDATGVAPSPVNSANSRQTIYTYDRADRLTSTKVTGLQTGEWSGASFALATSDIVSSTVYDKDGNVIQQTDGRGNSTYTWYDKIGRQVAQIDAENYLTSWTRDAEGNVLSETRYANKVTGAFTSATAYSTLPTLLTTGAADGDRTTQFMYDRNGRRLTETRTNVAYATIQTNGTPVFGTASAIIYYTYNGLNQVLSKTEANGDVTQYSYDSIGRLTLEKDQSFKSYQWTSGGDDVQPITAFVYDGLNNLLSSRVQAAATANDANDRITTYTYGAGGRLTGTTNAIDNDRIRTGALPTGTLTHTYGYDIAGRQVLDSYVRAKADGTTVTEAAVSRYDLSGHVITQTNARYSGSAWVFTSELSGNPAYDAVRMQYDAYGEMTGRAMTSGYTTAVTAWQEKFDYDAGGRLWHSNTNDGVDRFYLYDKDGNQALTIQSAGADLSSYAANTTAFASLVATINGSGDTSLANTVTTGTAYDKRGMAIFVRAPDRQLTMTGSGTLITTGRTYNAFGELSSETDGRGYNSAGAAIAFTGGAGYTTNYTYNTMGKMTSKVSPQMTMEVTDTTTATFNPTEKYGYDLSGRLVSVEDADSVYASQHGGSSYYTTRLLLAGSGHGDADALVTREFHPDGGYIDTKYDVFGDAMSTTDAVFRTDSSQYDKLGQLVELDHSGGLHDTYTYDVLGQRITHAINAPWITAPETTDYDVKGRVVKHVAFGDSTTGYDTTTIVYAWDANMATTGMGTYGGYVETTTYANGRTSIDKTDYYGHLTSHQDMGGHVNLTGYDKGGRLVSRSLDLTSYSYFNTGLVSQVTIGTVDAGDQSGYDDLRTTYGYDALGQKLSEAAIHETGTWNTYESGDPRDEDYYTWQQFDTSAVTQENATATYDALGRMLTWSESGTAAVSGATSVMPAAGTTWSYDASGNVRHVSSTFNYLTDSGAVGSAGSQNNWYAYDVMNRVITSRGIMSGGVVVRGTQGVDLAYDAASERVSATTTVGANMHVERYGYDAAGNMTNIHVADAPSSPGTGALKSTLTYDILNRMTRQQDWTGDGTGIAYDRAVTYDAKNRVTYEAVTQKQGNDLLISYTTSSYADALAGATYVYTDVHTLTNGDPSKWVRMPSPDTTTTYDWYDGAVQSTVVYRPDYIKTPSFSSYYYYSPTGTFSSAYVSDGRPRTVTVTNDAMGQAIKRDEADYNAGGDPHEIWYRFNGKQMGYVGNNGTVDVGYTASIATITAAASSATGAFRGGASTGTAFADFDQNYTPVNAYSQGSAGGSYTIQGGETLSDIASQEWGDSSLWYKIAEANGLTGNETLVAGQTLLLPGGINAVNNNSTTFKPYDPSDAYGNTSPTTPKPQKKNPCGTFGMILLMVVTIAVTAVATAGIGAIASGASFGSAFSAMLSGSMVGLGAVGATATTAATAGLTTLEAIGVGMAGAMVGSAVGQAFGLATGIQQGGFNWKGVALAGITAGVTAGIGPGGVFGKSGLFGAVNSSNQLVAGAIAKVGSSALRAGLNATLSSVVSQGVGRLTGLQKDFDWAGVAAAGVGSTISSSFHVGGVPAAVSHAVTGVAGGLANAAARSLFTGTDFGDNLQAALPDIIGSTIGNLITDSLENAARKNEISKAAAEVVADLNAGGPGGATAGFGGDIDAVRARALAALAKIRPDLSEDLRSRAVEDVIVNGLRSGDLRTQFTADAAESYDPSTKEAKYGTINVPIGLSLAAAEDPRAGAEFLYQINEGLGHALNEYLSNQQGIDPQSTPGEAGGRFAAAYADSFDAEGDTPEQFTLSNGRTVSFSIDDEYYNGMAQADLSSGRLDQSSGLHNGVYHYDARGHYLTTYSTVLNVLSQPGYNKTGIKNAFRDAALAAVGSQALDIYTKTDAIHSYWSTLVGNEATVFQKLDYAAHALPSDTIDLSKDPHGQKWLAELRADAREFIEASLSNGDYFSAGLGIHTLGDSYAHLNKAGDPYIGGFTNPGHAVDGHDPDLIFAFSDGPKRFLAFQADLANVVAQGFQERFNKSGFDITDSQRASAVRYSENYFSGVLSSIHGGDKNAKANAFGDKLQNDIVGYSKYFGQNNWVWTHAALDAGTPVTDGPLQRDFDRGLNDGFGLPQLDSGAVLRAKIISYRSYLYNKGFGRAAP